MANGGSIPRSNDDGHGSPVGYEAAAAYCFIPGRRAKKRAGGFLLAFCRAWFPFGGARLIIGPPIFGYGPYKQAIAVISHSCQQQTRTQKTRSRNKDFSPSRHAQATLRLCLTAAYVVCPCQSSDRIRTFQAMRSCLAGRSRT